MVGKWQELVEGTTTDSIDIELTNWTSRATLDAIGGTYAVFYLLLDNANREHCLGNSEAAFGYKFSALENSSNELANAFQKVM